MTWTDFIKDEQKKEYYQKMIPVLRDEYANYECYPEKDNIFKAFYSIPSPNDVKVVIIGQDPYHEPEQANGLAFSVSDTCKNPPSLVNIIDEIKHEFNVNDTEDKSLYHGDLTFLANQGVLLLNSTLTVRKGKANSHSDLGWQTFTDNIIEYLNNINKPMVVMLWGKFAKGKQKLITGNNILVLSTSHPSPLSANRGFFGCNHFKKCNEYLKANGIEPINWLGETYAN